MTATTSNNPVWVSYKNLLFKYESSNGAVTVHEILTHMQNEYSALMERPSLQHYRAFRVCGEKRVKHEHQDRLSDIKFSVLNPLYIESMIFFREGPTESFHSEKVVDEYIEKKFSDQALFDSRHPNKHSLIKNKIVFAQQWRVIMKTQESQSLSTTCKDIVSYIEEKISSRVTNIRKQDCLKFELNDILSVHRLLEKFVWNQRRINDDIEGTRTRELNGLYIAFYKSLIHERFVSQASGTWQAANIWADQIDNIFSIYFGANVLRDERRRGCSFMYPDVFVASIRKLTDHSSIYLAVICRPAKTQPVYSAYRDVDNLDDADLLRMGDLLRSELIQRHSVSSQVDDSILAYTFGALIAGPQITFYGMAKLAGNYSLMFELACFNIQAPNDRLDLPFYVLALANLFNEECESQIESIRKQPFSISD